MQGRRAQGEAGSEEEEHAGRLTLVAVISDTHLPRGARRIPAKCLANLERADLILHAGDFVEAGVLAELRALGPLEAVHGNMDEDELKHLLPRRRVVEVEEARIGITHDPGESHGRPQRLAGWFEGCDAVVYGHTHQPEVTRDGDLWILNPGSPTERRRAPTHTMLLLDVAGKAITPELVELA